MRIKKPHYDPTFKQQWRAREPQFREFIEEAMPRMMQSFHESRFEWIEDEWRTLVAGMKSSVHEDRRAARGRFPEFARIGYLWSEKISNVTDMIEYLFNAMRPDLGLSTGDTLASMLLVEQALDRLQRELSHHRDEDCPNGEDANQYRIFRALEILTPEFDDLQLQRLRALETAEWSARRTYIPAGGEVTEPLHRSCKPPSHLDDKERRDFLMYGQPMAWALLTRQLLASIDARFKEVDPLLVLEELGEADAEGIGGRSSGGNGRLGPARALAVLAVRCGALGFRKRKGETFDQAVDRARQVLMTLRSRVRRQLRSFRKKWWMSPPRPYARAHSKRSRTTAAGRSRNAATRPATHGRTSPP